VPATFRAGVTDLSGKGGNRAWPWKMHGKKSFADWNGLSETESVLVRLGGGRPGASSKAKYGWEGRRSGLADVVLCAASRASRPSPSFTGRLTTGGPTAEEGWEPARDLEAALHRSRPDIRGLPVGGIFEENPVLFSSRNSPRASDKEIKSDSAAQQGVGGQKTKRPKPKSVRKTSAGPNGSSSNWRGSGSLGGQGSSGGTAPP